MMVDERDVGTTASRDEVLVGESLLHASTAAADDASAMVRKRISGSPRLLRTLAARPAWRPDRRDSDGVATAS
jgi:hypothetical protein